YEDPAPGERVEPRHGVLVRGIARVGDLLKRLQRSEWNGLGDHERRFDAPQLNLRGDNQSRQAEASDRRFEELAVLGRRTTMQAVGSQEIERAHPSPKRSGAMVILAVNVVGDAAADGHELRARRDGNEPAMRDDDPENLIERRSRLAFEETVLAIESA